MRVRGLALSLLSILLIGAPAEARPPGEFDGLDSPVTIVRDADGIVHILARTEHDLVFMQGWAHARDRLFQMDLQRRRASGTLAELLGRPALASDVELRTLGLRRAAERSLDVLSRKGLAAIGAYAAGVNAYVAAHPLPTEYAALELTEFDPWTAVDSLAVAKLVAFGLSFDIDDIARTETLMTYQLAGDIIGFDGTALFFEDIMRSAPFDPASTIPDADPVPVGFATAIAPAPEERAAAVRGRPTIRPETVELGRNYVDRIRALPHLDSVVRRAEDRRGSNEWAVDGNHTLSGRPLLANDPHLPLGTPSTFYQNHLRAGDAGFDVIGASFPGVPFVILGNNRDTAWGATFNPMDVTDVFQEAIVFDPTSPSGLAIVHEGVNEPILPVPQVFRVNELDGSPDTIVVEPPGGDIPEAVLIVPRRNDGPIIEFDLGKGVALSVMYTGFSGTREIDAFRAFNRARDLDDFVAGLQRFDVGSQNWAYADDRGNIAYFTSAELPLRADLQAGLVDGLPPAFIRDGSIADHDWLPVVDRQPVQSVPFEILPFDEMPQVVNPSAGFFINANNDPAGLTLDNDPLSETRSGGGILYLGPGYDVGLRAGRITRRLKERLAEGPVTVEDMQDIQADIVQHDAEFFVPFIVDAFSNAGSPLAHPALGAFFQDGRVGEAVGRLAIWDGSAPTGIVEGFDATDIDGERLPPDQAEIDASVAATLYTVWRSRMVGNTVDAVLDGLGLPKAGSERTLIALKNLFDTFPDRGGYGASGLNFFNVPGVDEPAVRRDFIILQSLSDALDLLAGPDFADAFGGSTDQSEYRWGVLHRIVLAHPLGEPFSIPSVGGAIPPPLGDLPGLPADGAYQTVDPGNHSIRAADQDGFMFSSGASRRYVADFRRRPRRIRAESSLPGGASGAFLDPLSTNLLGRWLTNDTHPLRQRQSDIFRDAMEVLVARPIREEDDDDEDEDEDDS
ncbi:MAG: penicillin acylase family protein [Inquilinus sp.]|nr:penicillin acylase family protein [Inquilinus sp.]